VAAAGKPLAREVVRAQVGVTKQAAQVSMEDRRFSHVNQMTRLIVESLDHFLNCM
jgi:hypothetical protein